MASTEVILLEKVDKLGSMGQTVSVRPGYARNYLLPQRKALRATDENKAYFEAQREALEAQDKKRIQSAQEKSKSIEGATVSIIRQASERGQLYGSVAARDIAEELSQETKTEVAKNTIILNTNIKMIGLFPIEVALHPDVRVKITVNIARTPEEAIMQAKTGVALIAGSEEQNQPEEAKAPKEEDGASAEVEEAKAKQETTEEKA